MWFGDDDMKSYLMFTCLVGRGKGNLPNELFLALAPFLAYPSGYYCNAYTGVKVMILDNVHHSTIHWVPNPKRGCGEIFFIYLGV